MPIVIGQRPVIIGFGFGREGADGGRIVPILIGGGEGHVARAAYELAGAESGAGEHAEAGVGNGGLG